MTKPTSPSKQLSAESRKLWRSVLADCELAEAMRAERAGLLDAHRAWLEDHGL